MTETAPPVDLRPDHWAIVRDVLQQHIPDRKVLAFGSRATWTAKEYSDLDLAILGDEPLPLSTTSALAEGFSNSDLSFKVDFVDWISVDEAFRDIIRRDGVEVQMPESDSDSAKHSEDFVNANWRTATIEEVSEKVAMGPFGSSIRVETFVPEGIPIISGQHLHSTRMDDSPGHNFISEDHAVRFGKANVQRRDVVFTHAGNIGQVSYIPENSQYVRYIISQRQFCLRCDQSKVIPEFLTYFFKSPEGQHKLLANASQVGVPSIAQPVTYLRTIEIPLPPISEQRAIAHILGKLDDKVDLNRRMNETLEAMVQAIFKDWFVDFGPVRAKMEGHTPYLPAEIWDIFPDTLDDEDKPNGWKVITLEGFLELAYGKSLPAKKRKPGSVAVYGSGGITGTHDTALVDGPAIIVGRKGTVGSVYWEDGPIFPIDTVFYVIPRIGSMLFNYQLLAAQPLRDMNTDAAVPGLNRGNAYRLAFTLPDLRLIAAFDDVVGVLWRRRAGNIRQIEALVQTRDIILPELMSGVIRLSDST